MMMFLVPALRECFFHIEEMQEGTGTVEALRKAGKRWETDYGAVPELVLGGANAMGECIGGKVADWGMGS